MERRDVVLAHWMGFQNGDDPNSHLRSFERAWDFSARIRDISNAVIRMSSLSLSTILDNLFEPETESHTDEH